MKPSLASASDRRKPKVWRRDRTTELIQLYREKECLWNHYTENYKSKEHRSMAIASICAALHISKFDFGKKIHNLRNQFNSEMKKMDRRIEEAGGSAETDAVHQRCRWEHFEALKFLRLVIEPRPGRFRQSPQHSSQPKKMKMKVDYPNHDDSNEPNLLSPSQNANVGGVNVSAENVVEYHIEDATGDEADTPLAEDFESCVEEAEPQAARENICDHEYHPPAPYFRAVATVTTQQELKTNTNALTPHNPELNKPHQTRLQNVQHKKQQQSREHHESIQLEAEVNQHLVAAADRLTGAIPSSSATNSSHLTAVGTSTNLFSCLPNQKSHPGTPSRDQWDSFGELVASEFRHLNSDISRKLLKRKIMQAMLEIGERDDGICTDNTSAN